ncbi:alcohol dehydrogenase [Rhodobacter sp. NTK016B]|uniref:alcohol dehydrogenase n=1 Tax=Rhodobacter sp. NTK016B TaxID=2759676 RepID=UPI00256FB2A8|nr:alcohol dehydrogenase [Rhodobacter sp. NTK016B]
MRNDVLIYRRFGPPLDALTLETPDLPPRPEGAIRVAMLLAPVNPSDLIPVTGAYAHRITLPEVASYEGVGRVIAAPPDHAHLLGQRILPLRSGGTWRRLHDCVPDWAVPVPDDIPDAHAARAYINPMAAAHLLAGWPVSGRRVLLSGAGSHCASSLARGALSQGAASVQGIYRSPARRTELLARGVEPVAMDDLPAIREAARRADVTFDALGGPVATAVLEAMRPGSDFVGYGLLTGEPLRPQSPPRAGYHRFHLRESQAAMSPRDWQDAFAAIWDDLRASPPPEGRRFALSDWRAALHSVGEPGAPKPLLDFT